MIPAHPKSTSRKLQWLFILCMQAGILSIISCHAELTGQDSSPETDIKKLQQKLIEERRREKALRQEDAVAQNFEPYLLVNLATGDVELKAKGRILRAFKIKQLKKGLDTIPDAVRILSEIRPMQKVSRPRLNPGAGESATAESAPKMQWGPHRMPLDYDLVCGDGMVLEFRALPSKQTGHGPIPFIKAVYRRAVDWYRHGKSSDRVPLQTIQIWLDENDSRLLFWSLPKQIKILIVQADVRLDLIDG